MHLRKVERSLLEDVVNYLLSLLSVFQISFHLLGSRELEVLINSRLPRLPLPQHLNSPCRLLTISFSCSKFPKYMQTLMKLLQIVIHIGNGSPRMAPVRRHQTEIRDRTYTSYGKFAIPLNSCRKPHSVCALMHSGHEACQNDIVDTSHLRATPHCNLPILFPRWLVLRIRWEGLPYLVKGFKSLMFLQKSFYPIHQVLQNSRLNIMKKVPSDDERWRDTLQCPQGVWNGFDPLGLQPALH